MRFIKTKAGLVTAGAAALLFVAAPGALANNTLTGPMSCGFLSLSACGHGGDNQNATRVYACDDFADGIGYGIEWKLASGKSGTVIDANGSAAGCTAKVVGTASNKVATISGCELDTPRICTFPEPG